MVKRIIIKLINLIYALIKKNELYIFMHSIIVFINVSKLFYMTDNLMFSQSSEQLLGFSCLTSIGIM